MANLILYNDEHNDFQHVVRSISNVLLIDPLTANQLATLAHYKGSIIIKEGDIMDLIEYQKEFTELNLKTKVSKYDDN